MAFTLADAIVNLGGDDSGLGKVLGQARQKTEGFVSDLGKKVLQLGSAAVLGGVAAVTTGVIGIGIAAFDTSTQIDTATKNIQTQLGSLQNEAHDFGDVIKQVYGNNFGDSIEDVGQAISDTANQIDRLGQMSDQELGHATEPPGPLEDLDQDGYAAANQEFVGKNGFRTGGIAGGGTASFPQGLLELVPVGNLGCSRGSAGGRYFVFPGHVVFPGTFFLSEDA